MESQREADGETELHCERLQVRCAFVRWYIWCIVNFNGRARAVMPTSAAVESRRPLGKPRQSADATVHVRRFCATGDEHRDAADLCADAGGLPGASAGGGCPGIAAGQ